MATIASTGRRNTGKKQGTVISHFRLIPSESTASQTNLHVLVRRVFSLQSRQEHHSQTQTHHSLPRFRKPSRIKNRIGIKQTRLASQRGILPATLSKPMLQPLASSPSTAQLCFQMDLLCPTASSTQISWFSTQPKSYRAPPCTFDLLNCLSALSVN